MLTATSRYGARVLPNTEEIIGEVERRGRLVDGPQIAEFERSFAARLGADVHAVTTSFGRMAFYYILRAMNLPAGGEVIMPALTFWVMPEMVRVAGLVPVFADVDPDTFVMTPDTAGRAITDKTVAIVPTHLWGLPCDMDGILSLARARRIAVIEDCAHALGATYHGQPAGTMGDAAIFSFQTLKPLNTYGGGMAVTRDAELAAAVRTLAYAEPPPTPQGIKKKLFQGRVQRISIRPNVFTWTLFPILWASTLVGANPDVYLWEKIRRLDPPPPNYRERYSNVQAAIGLEALTYLDRWTSTTQANAAKVSAALAEVPGARLPLVPAGRTHVYYQYCAYLPSRDELVLKCLRRGVDLETLHVDVCPELELFGGGFPPSPGAEATEQAVQVPVYESLTAAELERVARAVKESALSLQRHAVGVPARG